MRNPDETELRRLIKRVNELAGRSDRKQKLMSQAINVIMRRVIDAQNALLENMIILAPDVVRGVRRRSSQPGLMTAIPREE